MWYPVYEYEAVFSEGKKALSVFMFERGIWVLCKLTKNIIDGHDISVCYHGWNKSTMVPYHGLRRRFDFREDTDYSIRFFVLHK